MAQTTTLNPITIRAGIVPDDVELCVDVWVRAVESRDGTINAEAMALRVRSAFENQIVRFAVATTPRIGFSLVEAGYPMQQYRLTLN